MVQGHTKIPRGECHRHENMFGNEMTKNQTEPNFCNKRFLVWMLVGVQTNHGSSSMHAQWFSCQNGEADDHDVII